MMRKPVYITGNKHKASYLARLLGVDLEYRKLDLDEIQSANAETVVEHKVRQAYDILQCPVLVEDTCMGYDALDGLPGPFIKFFIEQDNGAERLCRIGDGLDTRDATASVIFGYYDGEQVVFFHGSIHGKIADHPAEMKRGFGWDSIFIPDGYDGRCRSLLSADEYDELYEAIKPIAAVRAFLNGDAI